MPVFKINTVDWVIIIGYFVFIIWRGFGYAKKIGTPEDYFLAGRSLAWPLIGLSLYASNISSSSLVGMAGSGYTTGFSVFSYEWMAAIVLTIFAVFFLPFYLRSKIYTTPEFLERRYAPRLKYYFSGLTVLTNIGVDTAATLYAGALVIQLIIPEVKLWQSIVVLAIFSGLYTIAGGLRAVVYTDAIQALLLIVGSIIITISAFIKIGSWAIVKAVTPPEHFNIIQPAGDAFLPWPGLFSGVFLLGFYFWATNQFIVQRTLGARDLRHGQWGSIFAGFLKVATPLFIMILPGTLARVLYPDIEKANLIYPILLFDLLPTGLLGLVLAGLLAAMMSSIDSALNSASTLITMDFYRRLYPHTTPQKLMGIGRVFTFAFMVAAATWAPQIDKFPTLWVYLQSALSYIVPPIVALFFMGVFWKRANSTGALAGVVAGVLSAVIFLIGQSNFHFLYIAGIIFGISCLAIFCFSMITPPPAYEKTGHYTWVKSIWDKESAELRQLSIFANYRYQAGALLAFTALILAIFW